MTPEQIFIGSVAAAAFLLGWFSSKARWFQKHDEFLGKYVQSQLTEIHNRTNKIEGLSARLHVQEGRIGEIRRRLFELAQTSNNTEKTKAPL